MGRVLFLLLILAFMGGSQSFGQTMNDYCAGPPTVSTAVPPDVMIVMDFSGSMQFPAYLPCNFTGYSSQSTAQCGTNGAGTTRIADYDASRTYYGYFDTTRYYTFAASRFEENTACAYTDKIGAAPGCISGNILNWLTSTRVDVARKVLTGGRTRTGATDTYESEGSVFTYTDGTLHCRFTVTATTPSNRSIAIANQTGFTCQLGTLTSSSVRAKAQNVSQITGIVQDFYTRVHFEFMVFASDNRNGEIRSGKDATLSSLVQAINNELPYYGTPTGEALWEAYDYFAQSNLHNYEANSPDIAPGNGNKDPWYDGSGANSTPVRCRKSFVLLFSDGAWNGSVDPVRPAREMLVNDLRAALSDKQYVRTYPIYAFGDLDPGVKLQGRQAMVTTGIFGGFDDTDGNTWPYTFTAYPSDSRLVTYPRSQCNPAGTWDTSCKEWDRQRTGLPDNFFEADEGDVLKAAISNALFDILRRASAGTAVSVLALAEGTGANLMQALYYPKRDFAGTTIDWTGTMQNLWYYIDPSLQSSSIREDTVADSILNLSNDYVVQFNFDASIGKTQARRYDNSGALIDIVDIENLKNLWESGSLLFSRDLASAPRTLYTNDLLGGSTNGLMEFSLTNEATLRSYLQATSATEGQALINYVHGADQAGYRGRTVTIGGTTAVWKLGDIISSTPRIVSSANLNSYHLSTPMGYGDLSYQLYLAANNYRNRGMVFAGANDGMLHAFKLGRLSELNEVNQKAQLTNPGGPVLGSEEWAYIPRNALPYLKYLADPNYCHLYYVDGAPNVFDASVNYPSGCAALNYWDCNKVTSTDLFNNLNLAQTSWRTILIGSMGQGGGCRFSGAACTDCVKSPVANNGLSSYFALDVTDPSNPRLLWEFSDPALGFSTTGPAIVRVGAKDKNGRWFAVFGSGPTGPIDTSAHQFLGRSDQNLKLFVFDLKDGPGLNNANVRVIDTAITNAFAGSLINAVVDADRWSGTSGGAYQDDVLYVGYVSKSGTTWTDGGVLRVLTKEDTNPYNWAVSTVISGIGPVSSAIAKLQDRTNHNLWLYFGTGRYYFKSGSTYDDPTSQRTLFGVKDLCYDAGTDTMNKNCTALPLTTVSLTDQTTSPTPTLLAGKDKGWFINLDGATGSYGAERVITDPLAAFSGVVFFTTFAPTADACGLGGNSYLWGLRYDVGNAALSSSLMGEAMLQTSTGEISRLGLPGALNQRSGRRSGAITGAPPRGQGLSTVVSPQPAQKFLHIQER